MKRLFPYEIKMAHSRLDILGVAVWQILQVAVVSFVVGWAILALLA